MLPIVGIVLIFFGAHALPDTKIDAKDTCEGSSCFKHLQLSFPKTVNPVTPRFDFQISGAFDKPPAGNPVFSARGSLGLPHHPLGIFGFNESGSACGQHRLNLLDGVLATITINFPPCSSPWGANVSVTGHVDVWTTIPAVPIIGPIGISTGFTLNMVVSSGEAGADADYLKLRVDLTQAPGKGADPKQDVCTLDTNNAPEYPPKGDNWTIPTYTIDLDADPINRWNHVVKPLSANILAMIDEFIAAEHLHGITKSRLVRLILDLETDKLLKKIPSPYDDEIRGIAKATGIPVSYIFVYNIMYELMGLCTSLVAQDKQGHVYHARNLDFGLFIGSDSKTHTWALTEKLRPLLMNLVFTRGGQTVYHTTQYAGYVGLLTGMRKGGFSISVDTRFDGNLDRFLLAWLRGKYEGEFLSFKTRTVMESYSTYTDALDSLTHWRPIGPCYVIVGGSKANQGAVLQLGANRDTPLLVRSLTDASDNYYVAQTNYDWPAPPPSFDDRRYPVMDCLNKLGSGGINLKNLWGVMSSNPTKNALTTYTTLMSAATGHFEAYSQYCAPGPTCQPFLARDSKELYQLQREVLV
jgi:acid ceramidase